MMPVCRLAVSTTVPSSKLARCLMQLQHRDALQQSYSVARFDAIAQRHGILCLSDFSSLWDYGLVPEPSEALSNAIQLALRPSEQFAASF